MHTTDYNEIFKAVENYRELDFEDWKYSYLILKPNSAKHFSQYLTELEEQKFEIIAIFAVFDYETVNMVLHPKDEVLKYIVPITRLYNDIYSNYAVLLLIGKKRIKYEDFVVQLYRYKKSMRDRFDLDYVSFAFDTSKIGRENKEESLKIIGKDGQEVEKDKMNTPGTYMVFSPNEVHSPDADVETTVDELKILRKMGLISLENMIPKPTLKLISKYGTYAFFKDM